MFFNFKAVTALLALATSIIASPLELDTRGSSTCTDTYRAAELNGVAPAFSDQTPGATAKYLAQLPLKDNAQLILYINGAPGITVANTATLVRTFALGVRQVFFKVTTTSNPATTNFANGTSHTELEIVLGPRVVGLPVNIHAGMNFNYDLSDCKIKSLQGFLTIPSQLGGVPVNPTLISEAILNAGYAGQSS